jgi:hypothetical protein
MGTWWGGNQLLRVENHVGPAPEKVLMRRVKTAIAEKRLSSEETDYLMHLAEMMTDDRTHKLTAQMFSATCGLSVRWALRNFENMLQSPLLGPPPIGGVALDDIKVSQIARAYFWTEHQSVSRHAFENLYQIDGDKRVEYRLIKPRALDVLFRAGRGRITAGQLLETLLCFGNEEDVIIHALTELMFNTRPLLWSEVDIRFDPSSPQGRIGLTPIGQRYYNLLFGELYYEEVCLATSLTHDIPLEEIYQAHVDFTARDFDEMRFAMDAGGKAYYKFYSLADCALSLVHWGHLKEGILKRVDTAPHWFDPQRDHYIRAEVHELLQRV